ncbi:YqgE/AlgH family protein [Hyphomicrobium sp.]|uniref:YqgE/AlgH family protein n=1 Tax=Hyphomicrobium sp. TaxID=82 RepID=UPI002C19D8B9|nr:YqgE/AlgH family protein [Hyphomicrobium sp.]HRN87037.1 YqgE/AlgH family protein [Hyphomicrobium sp.]HRQ28065.1 YqgE/AlgH family protein [Hyphomicrobium sp.]
MMRTRRKKRNDTFLKGQLLVAMPLMTDRRFARSVIYMCAHSDEGAMGLIINHRADHISFPDLLERLGIIAHETEDGISNDIFDRQVHVGGPVETGRGFVLHSADYHANDSTLPIDREISLTASVEILKAIATGEGPSHAMLALGYAGWSAGQLESEIQANGWLHCPADLDLLFDADLEGKYTRALAKIGVDPSHLVSDAGHA